jgi:hypothetical protein
VSSSSIVVASISGTSTFFYVILGIALIAGIGVILRAPWPIRGLGFGLIAGAAIIALIILTGPTKH